MKQIFCPAKPFHMYHIITRSFNGGRYLLFYCMSLYCNTVFWNYRPFSGAPPVLQTENLWKLQLQHQRSLVHCSFNVKTSITTATIPMRSRSLRGSSPLRWASLKPKPEWTSGCPFQDHLDLHSETTSNKILDPKQLRLRLWLIVLMFIH